MAFLGNFEEIPLNPPLSAHEAEDEWMIIENGKSQSAVKGPVKEKWVMVGSSEPMTKTNDPPGDSGLLVDLKERMMILEEPRAVSNKISHHSSPNAAKEENTKSQTSLQSPDKVVVAQFTGRRTHDRMREIGDCIRKDIRRKSGPGVRTQVVVKTDDCEEKAQETDADVAQRRSRWNQNQKSVPDSLECLITNNDAHIPKDTNPKDIKASSEKTFRLPKPEAVLEAIPPEGITSSDLVDKFRALWPAHPEGYAEWGQQLRVIVLRVGDYDPKTKLITPKNVVLVC